MAERQIALQLLRQLTLQFTLYVLWEYAPRTENAQAIGAAGFVVFWGFLLIVDWDLQEQIDLLKAEVRALRRREE